MRRAAAAIAAAVALVPSFARQASASTHQASVGNYWYEDDMQHDRTKIVVRQGDQITFTVREQAVPGHTVDIDEMNIHSPNLNLGETYTTVPLNTIGRFRLYCRPHEQRGHYTLLVVDPKAAAAPSKPAPHATRAPGRVSNVGPTPSPLAAVTPSPAPLTPLGVGTSSPGSLDRPVPTNPNSLGALTGRATKSGVPWTRSLWLLAIAAVPIVAAAGFALRRARVAQYQPTFENVRRARASAKTKPKSPSRKRPTKPTARKPPRKR